MEQAMPRIAVTTDQLNELVATNAGATSTDETVVRDAGRLECQSFERLKAELQYAFALPDNGYTPLTAAEVVARNER
ncbi:MAG: addiction module antitoxin [Hyphomicrobiales bacterium]|nr:MAG: addiction module antitoxin [Hyphomicrobiales bacterium]